MPTSTAAAKKTTWVEWGVMSHLTL